MRARRRWGYILVWGIVGALALTMPALSQDPDRSEQSKVRPWLASLQDANVVKRIDAAHRLTALGKDSEAEVRLLVGALRHSDAFVRRNAAAALGEFPVKPAVSGPALVKALEDSDPQVRAHATVALIKAGQPVVPYLIAALKRPVLVVGKERIGEDGQTTPRLSDYALHVLAALGSDAAKALVKQAREDVRAEKAGRLSLYWYALVRCGKPAVAPLKPCLVDDNPHLVRFALSAIRAIGVDARDAAPEAGKAFDRHPSLAKEAIDCLSRIGAVAKLSKILESHPDAKVRALAAMAMWRIGKPAFSALENALEKDRDVTVRVMAARAFVRMRLPSPEAIPVLARALSDDPKVQEEAVEALGVTITGPSKQAQAALPALRKALRSSAPSTRAAIPAIFGAMGSDAKGAVSDLLRIAKTPDDVEKSTETFGSRNAAISALGEIDPQSKEVIVALTELLSSKDRSLNQGNVAAALGRSGNKGTKAVPALVENFRGDEYNRWASAKGALLKIRPDGVAALIKLATTSSEKLAIRIRACEALKPIAPTDKRVEQALIKLLEDRSTSVRRQAALALVEVRGAEGSVYDVLKEWLDTRPAGYKYELYEGLAQLGQRGAAALVGRMAGAEVYDRREIARAMQKATTADAKTIAALGKFLNDGDHDLQVEVAAALGAVGKKHPEAAKQLLAFITRAADTPSAKRRPPMDHDDGLIVLTFAPTPVEAAFNALLSLRPLDREAVMTLTSLLKHKDGTIRRLAIETCGSLGSIDKEQRVVITEALYDKTPGIRLAAVAALESAGGQLSEISGGFTDACINEYVMQQMRAALNDAADTLRPPKAVYTAAVEETLPRFPWPPPQYTHLGVFGNQFKRSLLGGDDTKLGVIYKKLVDALYAVDQDFESGLFGVPGGFALLARMEHINDKGYPLKGSDRWLQGREPIRSLSDYIARLFFEKPGYYRVIAFVVTPESLYKTSTEPLPRIADGAQTLPKKIADASFKGKKCYVLVYSLEREPGGASKPFSALSVYTHVERSGILTSLMGE
jgi:HEAT repeat protein